MPMLLEMELNVTAAVFLFGLVFAIWHGSRKPFTAAKRFFRRVVDSPIGCPASLAIIALVIYALPSIFMRVPAPVIHDEFAYLLAGDTFSHGRLSNPSHPLSRFFETFHVIQTPTYAAKFPPGPGLMLAVGYLVGLPIFGVWLSLALAVAAVYWMLRALVPQRWAALIALIGAVHPTVIWFSQTYWGGGLSILGGALVSGSMLRIAQGNDSTEQNYTRLGLIAGLGMGILALTRPFEGILFSSACGIAMLYMAIKHGRLLSFFKRFIPATLIVPVLAISWLMYYDWRVTGKPLVMPYVLHTARYMVAPLFFWQPLPPTPSYPNEQMQLFHTVTEYTEYQNAVGWTGYWSGVLYRGGMILWAYCRPLPLLVPVIIALAAAIRRRQRRIVLPCAIICISVLSIHLLTCPWMRIAYMAPLYGLLIAVFAIGMRQLLTWRVRGQSVGRPLVRALFVCQLLMGVYALVQSWHANGKTMIAQREQILDQLHKQGGEHLVIVKYAPKYSPMQEWVYNAADIDHAQVVFARDLGEPVDTPILDYYPNRKTWILEIDSEQAQLRPMPAGFARGPSAHTNDALTRIPPD